MSAANGEGGAAAKGPPKGEDKKDDTIVKITGVAIATGIAYSLYKSVVVGKEEKPFGNGSAKSEPFHEQISIDKPEGWSKTEAGVKEKAGEFKGGVKEKAGEFKGAAEEKGKEVKSAAAGKGQEVKEAVEDGKEKAAEQEKQSKQQWGGWFSWLGGQAKEEKDEAAAKAEKVKEETKKSVEGGEKTAEEKGKNFFDQADDKLNQGKEEAGKRLAAAEANVEKAGATVVHKVHKLSQGGKPPHGGKPKRGFKEYGIVHGDTLWSISRRYGVTIDELKSENGIWNADFIVAGDTLSIPK